MPTATLTDRTSALLRQARHVGSRFLAWWLGELRGLVPGPVVAVFADPPPSLWVRLAADRVVVETPTGTALCDSPYTDLPSPELAGHLAEAGPVVLVLPATGVLRRVIELPAAATAELVSAASFEIDRQTPFTVDQVEYRVRLVGRDPTRKAIRVELAVVPRRVIARALALAEAWQLILGALAVAGDDLTPRLDFRATRRGLQPRSWLAEPWQALALAAGMMLVVGLELLSWHYHQAAAAASAEVVARRETVRHAEALRTELATALSAERFLPGKLAAPRAVEIIDALSRRVPDDSWVFELALNPKEIRLRGSSENVPALIEQLQAQFGAPEFRSPVIHGDGRSGDRFDIALVNHGGVP